MIPVTPYILTTGTNKFKSFLMQEFSFDMLFNIKTKSQVLFDCWRGKDMITWVKYTNEDNYVLEVYPTHYIIKTPNITAILQIQHPKTINDFINQTNMFGVKLYWSNWIDENFEPKEYLHKDRIKDYYVNLLEKMDKSHELI